MIIDGKKIAGEILAELKKLPAPKKFLGAVLVGNDPASLSFLSQKEKMAKELGVDFRLSRLSSEIATHELQQEINRLASDPSCGGIILQLPLPPQINRREVLDAIPQEKDVDVLSEKAIVAFARGESPMRPPPVAALEEILTRQKVHLSESKVFVIGTGVLVGKPIGDWLRGKTKALTIVDEFSGDYRNQLSDADIVVSGVGKANLFSRELKDGALVIDFGVSRDNENIHGDFDSLGAEEKNILFTPTPGGTGPILVAELFKNFYVLAI